MTEPLEPLNSEEILANLNEEGRAFLSGIEIFPEIDSTNLEALRRLKRSRTGGNVFLSELQAAGRGRHGRKWVSPYGRNLYLSVSWLFDGGIKAVEGLSLALGVATAEAIAQLGIQQVQLKWPNDLLWQERKIGGILIELEGEPEGEIGVVAGLGLNTSRGGEGMDGIDQLWGDLSSIAGYTVSRNQLAASVLNHWLPLLSAFPEHGFSFYREKWLELDRFADQPVTLVMGQGEVQGIARGVDKHGSLLLSCEEELLAFPAGEISLKGRSQ